MVAAHVYGENTRKYLSLEMIKNTNVSFNLIQFSKHYIP